MGMNETVNHHHPVAPPPQGVHSYYHPAMEYTSTQIPADEVSRRTPSPAAFHNPAAPFHSSEHYSPAGTTVVSSVSPTDQSYYHQQAYNMSMAPPQPVASAPYVPHVMTAAPVSGAPMMTWSGPPVAAPPSSVPHVVSTHEVNAAHYLPTPVPPPPPASQASQHSSHNSHSTSTTSTKQKSVVSKKRYTKAGTRNGAGAGSDKPRGDSVTARRQKRLERNRESARLSRRRRKQYLEVLEDRVTHLSLEMDSGRREHAARAIETVLAKRQEILKNQVPNQSLDVGVAKLANALNRASRELLVLSTFQTQQLKSFSLAPHTKFVMWLTLQGDTYFRGGRAASERLSAARIGERMLQSGNDRVGPFHSMWPLFCNEVGLSYDQEERVRNYQRTLLQTPETWLDRHTGKASGLAMQSLHDCFNSAAVSMRQRERSMLNGLSPQQRLKFLVWADKNKDRIQAKVEQKKRENPKPPKEEKFALSPNHHIAANLYILNHRLQQVLASLPRPVVLVGPADLKRLARRPSFESLGHQKEDLDRALTREASYASDGSLLKRSSSSQSMDDEDKPQPQQVSPEDGQETAIPLIEQVLGFVKELIPPSPPLSLPHSQPTFTPSIQIPSPAPVENPVTYHQYTAPPPVLSHASAPHLGHLQTVHYAPHPGAPIAYAAPVQHQVPLIHYQHHPHSAPPPQMMHQPPPHLQYYQPGPPPPPQQQPVQHHHVVVVQPVHVASPPLPSQAEYQQRAPQAGSPKTRTHVRGSSFLPPHLNVVPEEMFPSGESAEEIFMSLMNDEDWAIGEGIDMDSAA